MIGDDDRGEPDGVDEVSLASEWIEDESIDLNKENLFLSQTN